jgi:proteic killer suppression protein
VDIIFATARLEKIFASEKLLRKEYGIQADKIIIRMGVLKAAAVLADIPEQKPERRHELKGEKKGIFAVDLRQPFRLLFEPALTPPPKKEDGSLDTSLIKSIRILGVEDYH